MHSSVSAIQHDLAVRSRSCATRWRCALCCPASVACGLNHKGNKKDFEFSHSICLQLQLCHAAALRALLPCLGGVRAELQWSTVSSQRQRISFSFWLHMQLCHAVALRALLPCLGGVRALLPLAAQLDLPAAGWVAAIPCHMCCLLSLHVNHGAVSGLQCRFDLQVS